MHKTQQLLDPISTLCKLMFLNFKKSHTKLSIHDHVLHIHNPSAYQFIVRMYNGDGRENITELYQTIIRLIEWYIISEADSENNETNYQKILLSGAVKKLIPYLCDSFTRLQETYQSGNVILSLQFYINLLKNSLNGSYKKQELPISIKPIENRETLIDYDKMKNLWDVARLNKLYNLFENCFETQKDPVLSELEKSGFIDGYLRSAKRILYESDRKFQQLILDGNRK
jgi:hypothetical protein